MDHLIGAIGLNKDQVQQLITENTAISVNTNKDGGITGVEGWIHYDKEGKVEDVQVTAELKAALESYLKSYNNLGNMVYNIEQKTFASAVPTLTAVSSAKIAENLLETESGSKVGEEKLTKTREGEEFLRGAAALDKSIRNEAEEVLRLAKLDEMVKRDSNFLSMREEKAKAKAKEDERMVAEALDSRFNALVVPKLIDLNVRPTEDRLLIKNALRDGTLVIKEGKVTRMPKTLRRQTVEINALERQIGSAWDSVNKAAKAEVFAIAEDKTHDEKTRVIQSNLAIDLTKKQRESISNEMDKFISRNRIKIGQNERNGIVEGLKSGNADGVMKAVSSTKDSRVFEKLYSVMLRMGTEEMAKQVTTKLNVLEGSFGGTQIGGMLERKAKEMKIELNEEDKQLIKDMKDKGFRENREKAIAQLSGLLFEVMADLSIIEKGKKTDLPKVKPA